jgi:glucose/arabinose dehydrogenase
MRLSRTFLWSLPGTEPMYTIMHQRSGPMFRFLSAVALALVLPLSGCFRIMQSEGGGEARFNPPRQVDPSDVALMEGYTIEAVARNLTFPSAIAFDDRGRVYVTEAGYSYGDYRGTPRLLRIEPGGSITEIARGENPPWNGVDYLDGAFYVAGGHLRPGQVLRITPDGQTRTLVDGLPGLGDHFPNGPVKGPDGWLYFGVGTATNSGVVGMDNFMFGWPHRYPDFHDIPCEDVVLAGKNHTTPNPLTPDPDDRAVTGTFVPFGTPVREGQVIPGAVPCSGAVMRVRPDGTGLGVVAWGFRNTFGLAFAPDGGLYVTENHYDVRGSRPVFGTGDLLWRVEPGTWYGWPDFFAGRPLTEGDWFDPPGEPAPGFVLLKHPQAPPRPTALLGVHSSSNGMDFSTSPEFGYVGQAFIAQFGDMAPKVGKTLDPVGFKVVRVDVEDGTIHDFAINRGKTNGPASLLESGGLERPLDVEFSPDGTALYIADFGVMLVHEDSGIRPIPGTGVLWKITRTRGGAP